MLRSEIPDGNVEIISSLSFPLSSLLDFLQNVLENNFKFSFKF